MQKQWIKCLAQLSGVLLMVGFLAGLTACHRVPRYVQNPIAANLPLQQRRLLAEIEKSGIQVIKQGMVFTFVIPTDCYFTRDTRLLKRHREKDLDRLAQFIHDYTGYFVNPKISITGYSDNVWLYPARNRLSLRYAEIVANYFQEDGIDEGMIKVSGRGIENAIASNRYPMGTSFNRRVEVIVG